VDDDERDLPSGQVGHLLVRGPYTLRGYYRAEEDNRRAFTSDGFLRTGDLARRTAEGNLIVEGRTKDVINRGGEKIAAEEVEALLLRHAAVHGAALVAVPDDVLGEKSCAFVVARGVDPTLAEIKDFLRREGLAEFKLPDRLEIIGDLPHTAIGKIDKATLVRVAEQRRAQRRTERAR
jgi:2,3-dihydroxybenzoate-AMP ligase